MAENAINVPAIIPAAQPMSKAQRLNQCVYRPRNTGGNVWIIHTPPSSWKLMIFVDDNPLSQNGPWTSSNDTT